MMSEFIMRLFACIGIGATVIVAVSIVMILIMAHNAPHDPDDVWEGDNNDKN